MLLDPGVEDPAVGELPDESVAEDSHHFGMGVTQPEILQVRDLVHSFFFTTQIGCQIGVREPRVGSR